MIHRTHCPQAAPAPLKRPTRPVTGIALFVRALQSLFQTSAVFFVPSAASVSGLTESISAYPEIPPRTMTLLKGKVVAWLAAGKAPHGEAGLTVDQERWDLAMSESRTGAGERIGAIALARRVGESPGWTAREVACVQTYADLCGSVVHDEDPEPSVPLRAGLEALITRIGVDLMSVSTLTMHESLERVLQVMCEFFEVDACFLRRTNFDRESTVLVAEWPRRERVPDPDPLGEVLFGVDPVFDATRDLKEPFTMRPINAPDTYQELVEQATGLSEVSVAIVPMVRTGTTVGVLGFLKFGDRAWRSEETNALQAVASLLVNLEIRLDVEEHLRRQTVGDQTTGLLDHRALAM